MNQTTDRLDAVPVTLGNRVLVFCAARQEVFELNEAAQAAWDPSDWAATLEADATRPEPTAPASTNPSPSDTPAAAEPDIVQDNSPGTAQFTSAYQLQRFALAGVNIEIIYETLALARQCSGISSGLPVLLDARPADITIRVGVVSGAIDMTARESAGPSSRGFAEVRCDHPSCVPALKGILTEAVLARAPYEVALHAASLIQNGAVSLLCGAPGAGKTTLSVALGAHGWTLAGDDISLLQSDGRVVPVPLPAALKPGAWTLCAEALPDLASRAQHRRSDGLLVKYSPISASADASPLPVERIIILSRESAAEPALTPIDPVEALAELIADGFAPNHRLSDAGFAALITLLNSATCLKLHYRTLEDALPLLKATQAP